MEVKVKPPKKKTKPKTIEVKKEAKEETKETKETKPTETKPVEAKEIKPTTKETKPTTKPATKPKPKIKTTTWEKFEKFTPKTQPKKKSWIKEAIERAKKEPIEIKGLTKGQILALVNQVELHNKKHMDRIIDIKYDVKQGIALLAPTKKY
jgi:hypothetical protein